VKNNKPLAMRKSIYDIKIKAQSYKQKHIKKGYESKWNLRQKTLSRSFQVNNIYQYKVNKSA
jgi:hypothetical protein